MTDFKFKKAKWHEDKDGVWVSLNVGGGSRTKQFIADLKDKTYKLTIKEDRKKRSLDANAYFWVLMDKMAEKLNTSKEELYRAKILEVGAFTPLLIQKEAVDDFVKTWRSQGIGTQAVVLGESNSSPNCYIVNAYKGSSDYTTKEMARLIDWVVQEAKEMEIETLTPDEIERMKRSWE